MGKEMKMDREDAIEYLENKEKLDDPYAYKERKFNRKEEREIKKVMREGKIYGDPKAEIQF